MKSIEFTHVFTSSLLICVFPHTKCCVQIKKRKHVVERLITTDLRQARKTRKPESSRAQEDFCQGESFIHFNLGAILTMFSFQGDLPKFRGERSKNQGRRVSGPECWRGACRKPKLSKSEVT